MRAVVITKHGPPEVLRVQERPDPVPADDEVLIDVRASGINFADIMARLGFYPDAPKPPSVVGYEVAGTVAQLGSGIEGFAVGDRVVGGTRFGGYAERAVVRSDALMRVPEDRSFEEAAAVPINYATAWAALLRYGSLLPGELVLIHAAAGGVGIAATQIARRHGAEIWGTASPGKHDRIRGFGVEHPIDYTRSGWHQGLPRFDIILDAVGGRSFRTSYKLLAPGGRMVCFGASSVVAGERRNLLAAARAMVEMPRFNLVKQMQESKAVIGLNMLKLWDSMESVSQWMDPIQELLADGTIQPVVAEAFPFDRAADAHRMISQRRNVGKVVLVP